MKDVQYAMIAHMAHIAILQDLPRALCVNQDMHRRHLLRLVVAHVNYAYLVTTSHNMDQMYAMNAQRENMEIPL